MIAIVIPYRHTVERTPLLNFLIGQLPFHDKAFKIYVHEMGECARLRNLVEPLNVNYLFTHHLGNIKKAWCLNRIIRQMIIPDEDIEKILMLDVDILVDRKRFFSSIKRSKAVLAHCFNRIGYLTEEHTYKLIRFQQLYYDDPYLYVTKDDKDTKTIDYKKAKFEGNAGGAILIDKYLFQNMKGMPEEFDNTWGAEDNCFWYKLRSFGLKYHNLNNTVYHLYHKYRMAVNKEIFNVKYFMKRWNKDRWIEYLLGVGNNWGSDESFFDKKMEMVDHETLLKQLEEGNKIN